jgi:phage shock protein A
MDCLRHHFRRLLLRLDERLARPRADLLTKHVNGIVLSLSDALVQAKKSVACAIADEKRLAFQHQQETANAAEWETRAQTALEAGSDDLGKEALERRAAHEESAARIHALWEEQKMGVLDLKRQLRALNDRVEEAKRKKATILGRVTRGSARRSILRLSMVLDEASRALDEVDQAGELWAPP